MNRNYVYKVKGNYVYKKEVMYTRCVITDCTSQQKITLYLKVEALSKGQNIAFLRF